MIFRKIRFLLLLLFYFGLFLLSLLELGLKAGLVQSHHDNHLTTHLLQLFLLLGAEFDLRDVQGV